MTSGDLANMEESRQWANVRGYPQGCAVLASLKRDGWVEKRRSGSHRVLAKGNRMRVWAYQPSELGEL